MANRSRCVRGRRRQRCRPPPPGRIPPGRALIRPWKEIVSWREAWRVLFSAADQEPNFALEGLRSLKRDGRRAACPECSAEQAGGALQCDGGGCMIVGGTRQALFCCAVLASAGAHAASTGSFKAE